jgi:hypothetical protein
MSYGVILQLSASLKNRRVERALTSFVTLTRARASFSSILSAGADGQAVVCPLLRGSSPTRGVIFPRKSEQG